MSSLLFDPPLFGEENATSLPCVIIAADFQGSSIILLYADSDGYLKSATPEQLRTDWRWTRELGWYDESALAAEATGRRDG